MVICDRSSEGDVEAPCILDLLQHITNSSSGPKAGSRRVQGNFCGTAGGAASGAPVQGAVVADEAISDMA